MKNFSDVLSAKERKLLVRSPQPTWVEPMLATLVHEYFDHPDWIYERKLDGQRCLVFKKGEQVSLYSRNHNSLNERFPELLESLRRMCPEDFVADGEIVAIDGKVTSFSKLQPRMHSAKPDLSVPVKLYLFDLLHFEGLDFTQVPLRARKSVLKSRLRFRDPIRFTPHRNQRGTAFLQEAQEKGWEGLIAKDAGAAYVRARSKKWLKFKCENRQEFVVGGFTQPQGERTGFGALLLGFHRNGELHYAGKVGTGFDDPFLKTMRSRLDRRQIPKSPFADPPKQSNGIHWVRPELVAEVTFTEWTNNDKLRHPAFVGLRDDKSPQDVVKE